jgi:hypothetical protein
MLAAPRATPSMVAHSQRGTGRRRGCISRRRLGSHRAAGDQQQIPPIRRVHRFNASDAGVVRGVEYAGWIAAGVQVRRMLQPLRRDYRGRCAATADGAANGVVAGQIGKHVYATLDR